MLLIIHRWQPKTQRYQTQKFEIGQQEERVYMDMLFNKQMPFASSDPTQKQMVMRTQRVDRISIEEGMTGPTIAVYLSPIVERKYIEVKDDKGNVKKAKLSDVLCTCHHTADCHAPEANLVGKRICLTPGCSCSDLVIAGTRQDIVAESLEAMTKPEQKRLDVVEERCKACETENCYGAPICDCLCHDDNIKQQEGN